MRVLVTGANGFIGRNLLAYFAERSDIEVDSYTRRSTDEELVAALARAEFVFHLAGVNRPKDDAEFSTGNLGLTRKLCDAAAAHGRRLPILFASSAQVERDNLYGQSKREAESALIEYQRQTGNLVYIFRLPNVFGKWCRPNYNSAVATFCHNIARDLPIRINDHSAPVTLAYIDDVVDEFVEILQGKPSDAPYCKLSKTYVTTVGEVAAMLQAFRASRSTLVTERVGRGLARALYATYVSYLPPDAFAYEIPKYGDPRGVFVEMLKTKDSGQFSFFTAHPGVTRGGHYHHSKTEKFLVIRGKARFRFRHIVSDERHELETSGERPQVVETVPGWTHDITNIGEEEMIVMLWANEIFDRQKPDTFACPV